MTTKLKITGRVSSTASQSLELWTHELYRDPNKRIMAIVELTHDERTVPGLSSDKDASVTVKITGCEVPNKEQEETIREAQRALYLMRTATGTLDEAGQVELARETLRRTGGTVTYIEAARLRAGLKNWQEYARRVTTQDLDKFTKAELMAELKAIANGLDVILNTAARDELDQDLLDLGGGA